MLTPVTLMLAFASGIFGAAAGGTPAFIVTAGVTIVSQLLGFCGIDTTMFDLYGTNLFFLPAVCFTGGVAASAIASRKYDINGYDTWRSSAGFADPLPILAGGIAGTAGYIVFRLAADFGLPCDQGAFSVILAALIIRLFTPGDRKYDPYTFRILKKLPVSVWVFHVLLAGTISLATAWFAEYTGIWNIGYGVSGILLLFAMAEPSIPATHHVTLTAGYAMMMTHNLVIAVIFGILAELIGYLFTIAFNNRCTTHIDPPAFAILSCSLVLFTVF